MRWVGHAQRMNSYEIAKKIMYSTAIERRIAGRLKSRYLDDVLEAFTRPGMLGRIRMTCGTIWKKRVQHPIGEEFLQIFGLGQNKEPLDVGNKQTNKPIYLF